ncbi:MAG TPA: PEP-utilizing enzyme [Acidimicrobiales bacterium]|nr:PEP-utilizing enzyme [Acidimicrobiales bacterium]
MVGTMTWEKPGPGTWELDSSHGGPAPCTMTQELLAPSFRNGFGEGMADFGSPLKTLEMVFLRGKMYRRLVPLVGGGRDLPPPPAPVLKLVTRLHPAFRRAERRARESFETKRWLAELRRWEEEWKPSITKQNLVFSDVDVAALGDADLADHLASVHAHVAETTTLHFRLHVSDMGPLGNLMVHLEDWGLHRDDTFRALVAASPATRTPSERLREVADELRAAGVDPATVGSLDEVRAASPACAARLDEFLRFHGWRLTTGYELEDRCLIELPDVILRSVRAAASRPARTASVDDAATEALTRLRNEVPAEHRATFDELVADARASYGLRDENGPLTYEWPAGLLRRGLLEAGRRLGLGDSVFELSIAEVLAMLRGGAGPGGGEIARRAAERRAWAAITDAPARLGPEEAPPPLDVMPEHLARMTRIVLTVVETLEAAKGRESLTGTGIGSGSYVGTARVVHDAAEALALVEPGDVIVAPYTAPTYNAVLAMAGALVTEQGGLLCHAAVIARELGLPAVIGAADAMSRIPDGARVEVDPAAGCVTVLA